MTRTRPPLAGARRAPLFAAVVLALALIAGACGGSSGSGGSGSGSSGGAAGGPHTIVIKGFAFSPATLTVAPGAKVTVTNNDATAHTVTAKSGKFDSGSIAAGASGSFTAPTTPGRYAYSCTFHPFMAGTLVVS